MYSTTRGRHLTTVIAMYELGLQVKAAPHLPQAVPHGTLGGAHHGVSEEIC